MAKESSGSGNNGMVMLLGLGALAFFLLRDRNGENVVNSGNAGGSVTSGVTEEIVPVSQPIENVNVNIAEVNKPSVSELTWYLHAMANQKAGYSRYRTNDTESQYLRVKDWDYWAKSKNVDAGGGEQMVTLEEYVQLLLNKGVVK